MSEPMPYADIIILALIAGFILLRLRNILGQKTGNDRPKGVSQLSRNDNDEPVVTLPERFARQMEEKQEAKEIDNDLVEEKARPILEGLQKDYPDFSAATFLSGAKMAFEMVFEAFSKGDKDTLKHLLSSDVCKEFLEEIEHRKEQDKRPDTTLVAVEQSKITDAQKTGKTARITVKFVSEQITVLRDKDSKIIEGDPSQVNRVEDEWSFERDMNSRNPNWKIVAT